MLSFTLSRITHHKSMAQLGMMDGIAPQENKAKLVRRANEPGSRL